MRALCSPRRDGRRIELSPQSSAWLRQRAKRQDPVQQALLRRRKAIVEPVFATLKQAMGFRRWTVRGLENVRTQWALICTACNLKKLHKHWVASPIAAAANSRPPVSTSSLPGRCRRGRFIRPQTPTRNPCSPTPLRRPEWMPASPPTRISTQQAIQQLRAEV